ncbi:MAG: hypothetical protein JXQ73_15040 [Phycisphaerae bacterium]|nr:hypothetical protein [Phycisphaerae bacterium]
MNALLVVVLGVLGPVCEVRLHQVAASVSGASAVGSTLPEWSAPEGWTATPFRVGAGGKAMHIWGGATTSGLFFGEELLPALFERTLVLETLDLKEGGLSWIFTGDRGGFTVEVDGKGVRLTQRFYDSFGLTDLEGEKVRAKRHPERRWFESSVTHDGALRSVGVVLDHKLGLAVRLNGKELLHQECALDVHRHQLRLTGKGGTVVGRILSPPPAEAVVRIDAGKRYQTMMGFGGIATPTAYAELSAEGKRRWWGLVCEYNLLIQREYPIGTRLDEQMTNWDTLADATPHYYGDNFPNGEISDFAYIKTLRRLGGKVFFEFWDLPHWAKQDWKDGSGKVHKGVANPEVHAKAMVNYCRTSKERAGAPPDVVGIQNEVTQPAEIWHEMTLSLRRALDEAGFGAVRIHMSDHGHLRGGIDRAKAFKESAEAWGKIDYSATHMYDYQSRFTDPDKYDELLVTWHDLTKERPFLSTELCINSGRYQRTSYRIALVMGELYHKNLTLVDAIAICYCWTLLNVEQPTYGWSRTLCVPDRLHGFVPAASSHQLRVFGAYSRRIREGMTRVGAASSSEDLLATAFVGGDGARTIVLLNRSTVPRRVRLEGVDGAPREMERVDPYHENAVCAGEGVDGGGVVVAPGAIVTLSDVAVGRLPAGFEIVR